MKKFLLTGLLLSSMLQPAVAQQTAPPVIPGGGAGLTDWLTAIYTSLYTISVNSSTTAAGASAGSVATASSTPPTLSPVSSPLSQNLSGALRVQPNIGGVDVTNLPISAATLPLPTGAATATNQTSIIGTLGAVADAAYAGSGTSSLVAGLKGIYTKLSSTLNVSGTVAISALPALPSGGNAIGSVLVSNLPATQAVSGSISVSNLPSTQTVAGSVAVTALPSIPTGANAIGSVAVTGTTAVSAAALPLPTGAATSANQAAITAAGTTATSAAAMQGVVGGVVMPIGGTVAVSSSLPRGNR